MKYCLNCQCPHRNPKFCSRSCAVTFNNSKSPKRKAQAKPCLGCGQQLTRLNCVYCSVACRQNHRIMMWQAGQITGLNTNGTVTGWVKDWLRTTRGDACERCGWDAINLTTGKVPVVADHIDGDWTNNHPNNLRLLCPNCDSLQPTYGALNYGKGRKQRKVMSS